MLNKAIVDLSIIKQNALVIKSRLKDTKFCAVVKDNAYGHGIVPVAEELYQIADYYAVALLEEALKLRVAGIDKPILVLVACDKNEIEQAIKNNITLTVASREDAKWICYQSLKDKTYCKVHIKIDSGMNRQGISDLSELDTICKLLSSSKYVEIEGVYSHLACPEKNIKRKKQVNKFLLAFDRVKGYNKNVIKHISASGGFLKGEYFDMVRVGLLLYGYKPFENSINVKPAMKIIVPVIQETLIYPFTSALYGNKKSLLKRELSLVRFGYGDGLFRKSVKGQFFNKCMDLSLVDRNSTENGYLIISNFDILAKNYKTISYEIMVNISKRCEFIYLR